MDKNKQKIEGNNNIQIGVHNGDIIYTEKVVGKTELIHDSDIYISDAQAKEIRDRIQKIAEEMAGEKGTLLLLMAWYISPCTIGTK